MTTSRHNESWFLALNKKSAWDRGLPVQLRVSDEGITPGESVAYELQRTLDLGAVLNGAEVRDLAVGRCGLLYLLASAPPWVWTLDPDQALFEPVKSLDRLFSQPAGIAISPGTLYVADSQAPEAVFALARINWQIRWTAAAALATGVRLTPADMAVDGEGNLYVLDPADQAVVRIDRAGMAARRYEVKDLGKDPTREWAGAAISGGSLFILDRNQKKVLKLDLVTGQADPDFIQITRSIGGLDAAFTPSCLCTDRQGNLYIGEDRDDRAISSDNEDDRFIHKFNAEGKYAGVVPGRRGPVARMAIDSRGRICVFYSRRQAGTTVQERRIDILSPVRRPLPTGAYFSGAFDSTMPGTRWHKLVLDAEIPENTQVRISYLISDSKPVIVFSDGRVNKKEDLDAFLRDEEVSPEDRVKELEKLDWSEPLVNPRDALIGGPAGRYLWLKAELIVNNGRPPAVKSIRLYFPRRSYLRYLPAVYQEDEQSRDFLERFLSLFETMLDSLEFKIDHLAGYFDVEAGFDAGTGAFLRWLASWLAVVVDENWTEEALRRLVVQAPELYRRRGTRQGIGAMVELYTGCRPIIVEHFQLDCIYRAPGPGEDPQSRQSLQDVYNRLYSADPFSFCVLLEPFRRQAADGRPAEKRFGDEEIAAVRQILRQEAPAHTRARLIPLQPRIYLDWHTYLGINTYLARPLLLLDCGKTMPQDTVLTDMDEAGQIGRRSRLGLDTNLT